MPLSICVYSSSSEDLAEKYIAAARELGRLLGERGHALIFGGGNVGLMNVMAREILKVQGRVIGVIPLALQELDLALAGCQEMVVTDGMRDRKAVMEERAEAFIAMPGGFGTLEELLEVITLKQLRYHAKPIVILDVGGYYEPLLEQFERMFAESFAKRKFAELYYVTGDPAAALEHIEHYRPPEMDLRDKIRA
jgi:hypothetical protein